MTGRRLLRKHVLERTSPQQHCVFADPTPASLEQLPSAVCDAVSQAVVLIFLQIKVNLRLPRRACVSAAEGSLGWSWPRTA